MKIIKSVRFINLISLFPLFLFGTLTACSNSSRQFPDSVGTHLFTPVELPEKLEFAGEKVPMEYYDVRENLDRELLSTVYFHSQTIRYIKNMPRYFSIIDPISSIYALLKVDLIHVQFRLLKRWACGSCSNRPREKRAWK